MSTPDDSKNENDVRPPVSPAHPPLWKHPLISNLQSSELGELGRELERLGMLSQSATRRELVPHVTIDMSDYPVLLTGHDRDLLDIRRSTDIADIRADFSRMYADLRRDVLREGKITREVVRAEARRTRGEVVDCIRRNPVETLSLLSKWVLTLSVFSILAQAVSGLTILNPWFAAVLALISLVFMGMRRMSTARVRG